jgi:hypothetical protein
MTSNLGDQGSFLPTTEIFEAESLEELNTQLTTIINDMSLVINQKDSGIYSNDSAGSPISFVNSQTWFPSSTPPSGQPTGLRRQVFRKVVDIGALPNAGLKTVAHNISTNQNFSFTIIYATATEQGASRVTSAIPLPFASPTLANNISLEVGATNIRITTGSNRTNYTICYVVLEWIVN